MNFSYGIDEYLKESNNIYDLIGNCFGVLCDNIDNHQLFISRYLDEGQGRIKNPNIRSLNEFSEKVMEIVREYRPSMYQVTLKKILAAIDELKLSDYLDDKENQLTVVYCVLTAIDAVAMEWESKWMTSKLGPLDRQGKTRYRVYFNTRKTINSDYISKICRERSGASDFFEQFESFRFIDSHKWKERIDVPQVKYLPQNRGKENSYEHGRKIKISVIPVSCRKNFEFVPTIGSGLRVEYSNNAQDKVIKVILESLEKAINAESNIIVLPEYVVSSEVHEAIHKKLKEYAQRVSEKNKLIAVFEGTTWTEEDNNMMRILDSWGEEIGKYYKYSPFTEKRVEGYGFKQYEALRNPGKYCDLIAIEEIGLFLPAICRAAIDGEYTDEILKMLLPEFTIISAWSPSVASFETRERKFANEYFSSTVFANACSAVRIGSDKIGNGCIVSKEQTIAGASIENIYRDNCESTCGNGTCVYMLEYNFECEVGINTCISVYKL